MFYIYIARDRYEIIKQNIGLRGIRISKTLKNAAQRLAVPSVANGPLRRFIGQY